MVALEVQPTGGDDPIQVLQRCSRDAGTGGAGLSGALSLLSVMLEVFEGEQELPAAIAAPRLQGLLGPGQVWVEPALPASSRSALEASGLSVRWVEALRRANAASCRDGVRRRPEYCQAESDPRGWGLARRVE